MNSPLGLGSDEAAARLMRDGPNALPAPAPESLARRLGRQFHNPLIYLLLFAVVVDLAAWWWEGAAGLPLEAGAIALILIANATLGLYQEGRAEQALARLKTLAAPEAWVLRDGALGRIPSRELVVGDVVRLEAGDRIPADALVQGPGELLVDESLLTGESVPVARPPGEETLSGTLVVRGMATLEVLRTGPRGALGKLAGLLETVEAGRTPLEKRLEAFGSRVTLAVVVLSLVIVAAGVAVEGVERLGEVFLFAVALAVAAVPEGLPAVMTLALAVGVERMATRKAVVRRLPAVEALGSVTVIATDKTGTLTENRMQVRTLEADDPQQALRVCALASEADLETGAGDPVELALLEHARSAGLDLVGLVAASPRVGGRAFDSRVKFMRVTCKEEGARVSYLKGAPEVLLDRCVFEPGECSRWLERVDTLAAEGSKVIALARGSGDAEEGLSFAGLVALWDPPRAEVPAAIARTQAAGIRVIMITGDHPGTAAAIAKEVGIPCDAAAVTGAELEGADDEALQRFARETTVFARVSPEHKLRLVEALQREGEVVAMTGDGVNDAPALKRADVGVAMGHGSDVAREASDLVILDDNFATIVAAVEEGRSIYANVRKFLRFLFGTNVSELVVVLCGAAGSFWLGLRDVDGGLLLPLTAAMILWINLVTDSLPALTLALDANPDVMNAPPLPGDAPLLDGQDLRWVALVGVLLAVGPLLLLVVAPSWESSREACRAAAFHGLVIGQLVTAFFARALKGSPQRNHAVILAVLVGVGLQLALIPESPLHPFLGLTSISAELVAAGAVAVAFAVAATAAVTRLLSRA
jgi:P-type Ca2+ transporter type 2C